MWTKCRAHSGFVLFEIATKFSILWGGLMAEIVKKLHKSMSRWMSDECLCRMEEKLDKLSKAVHAIARIEERMLSVYKRLENIDGTF